MEILVKIKTVYGVERIYPVCDTAKKFSFLTGKKTFERGEIDAIKSLGFTVKVKTETL